MDGPEEECFARTGTQAHLAKFREMVAFVFLHGIRGPQQQLYRAGQPKKPRLKDCGVAHSVPCVSCLAEWPDALAEAVQVATMMQVSKFWKDRRANFEGGQV